MKEQMRIELHNETEYTERISFQDIWTHASRLKYAGCRVAAITDRNSVDGIHMAEYEFMRRGIQPIYGVTLNCIDIDDRYDVVLLAANLIGRDNIFRLIELLESNRFRLGVPLPENSWMPIARESFWGRLQRTVRSFVPFCIGGIKGIWRRSRKTTTIWNLPVNLTILQRRWFSLPRREICRCAPSSMPC